VENPSAADEIFGMADTERHIARRARVAPAGAVLS